MLLSISQYFLFFSIFGLVLNDQQFYKRGIDTINSASDIFRLI